VRTPQAGALAPWVRDYRREWLRRDLVGGVSAGAVVIPQAMAYATVADLPPEVGLYTCMVPMVVYALLGGSRTLSASTTSTIAVLTGSTLLAAGVAASSEDPARSLATLTLLVGAVLVLARVLHLGVLIDNVSDATLTGVKVGVGLTVAAGQLPALLGVPGDPSASNFFAELRGVIEDLGDVSGTTLLFSVGTLVVLVVLQRFVPALPSALVVVVGGIALVGLTTVEQEGLALITPVPGGLPTPVAPTVDGLDALVPGALAIAVMVFLESLAVGRSVRRPSEPPIDNDQELLAGGLACAVGALFRAMPSAGGFSQTATNQRAGARTQLASLVTVVLAVACALVLGDVLSDLPQATLAALVLVAVLGLLHPAELVRFWRLSRLEFWVAVATAVSGLFLGLVAAVAIGVVLTLLVVIVELDRIGVTELRPSADHLDLVAASDGTEAVPGLLVLRIDGPMYTANVRSVNRKLLAAVDARPGTRVLVVDATTQARLTVTVADQVGDLQRELDARHVELWVAGLPPEALAMARATEGWPEIEAGGRAHPTAGAALRAFESRDAG
jgi:sulfate permease, SulP family